MNAKHYELMQVANEFLRENYDMELTIPIKFNSRIKKVLGRFLFKTIDGKKVPDRIEISIDFMLTYPKEAIFDVLKHELIHYVLCRKELPFDDGHPIFENELRRHGVKRTGVYKILGDLHVYECSDCGTVFERKKRMPKTIYCDCDNGKMGNLEYKGKINKKPDNMVAFTSDNNTQ